MWARTRSLLRCALLLGLGITAPPLAWGQSRATLPAYAAMATEGLQHYVLPKLFYSGFAEIGKYEISIVQTGKFPAVSRQRQSVEPKIELNAVLIAAMDAVAQADYVASNAGGDVLNDYLNRVAESASQFSASSGNDWQMWFANLPRYRQFYQMTTGFLMPSPDLDYDTIQSLILTSAIGSVLAREITEIALASQKRSVSDPRYVDELISRSSKVILSSNFDVAPATMLIVYMVLKNVAEEPRQTLHAIECTEAKFQRAIRGTNRHLGKGSISGNAISFAAGEQLLQTFSCSK